MINLDSEIEVERSLDYVLNSNWKIEDIPTIEELIRVLEYMRGARA